MFFKLHPQSIIGYKKLSDADLGISPTSHQTHIGLYGDTLDFITNYYQESSAQLIYNNQTQEVLSLLDPITNPNGSFRSPKIKLGEINFLQELGLTSVTRKIRDIAQLQPLTNWYLIWFGLENEELVFFLIEEGSTDYFQVIDILTNLHSGRIQRTDSSFIPLIRLLHSKINNLNFNYFQELELFAQTDETAITKRIKPRRYDIIKAQKLFQQIGRTGEELVNNYLEKEKSYGHIKNFQWVNKSTESGFPFDFEITDSQNKFIYSDAKSTSYRFKQTMIFSSQELKFIQQNNNYLIHRVFDLNKNPKLRVCNNIEILSHTFVQNLNTFNTNIENNGLKLNGMKISVNPTLPQLNFDTTVTL